MNQQIIYQKKNVLELIAVMTHEAFYHEYAMLNLEDCETLIKKYQILEDLAQSRKKYNVARTELAHLNPLKLEEIEDDLRTQKLNFFVCEVIQ